MAHYHPSIEILTDYASGSLPLAHSMSIATHIEHCTECQQQVRKLNLLGAHLFDQVKTDDGSVDALKQSFFNKLTKLDEQDNNHGQKQVKETPLPKWEPEPLVPSSLRQFIPDGYDKLKWVYLSPSVKIATLCSEEGGAQVALTRIKAGACIPTHTHTGNEITLVLEGAFSDESGVYRQGDFINRDARHKHKPMVTKDAECICLTVLDSPIEFTGWFTRLLNPIMRRHHPHSHG